PAVILNQLAPAIDERLQVRIERVDRVTVRFLRADDVGIEFEALDGPGRIAEHDVPELIETSVAGRGGPAQIGPSELAPGRETRNKQSCLGVGEAGVNQPRGFDLRFGEAASSAGIPALEHSRIEHAALWVPDEAVLHAVLRVARVEDGRVQELTM